MTSKVLLLGVLGWIALGGCGSDEGAGSGGAGGTVGSPGAQFLGSCDTRSMGEDPVLGQCRDWNGSPGADLEVSCNGIGGVYSASTPCPGADRVFSCELDPTLGIAATYHYYAPDWTEADAQAHCDGLKS